MDDMTVDVVWQSILEIGVSNGCDPQQLRPVADAIVQSLRASGMDDETIERIFYDQET